MGEDGGERERERYIWGAREAEERERARESERARERKKKKEREERDIYAYLRRHSRECLTPGTRGLGRTGAKKIYHRRCIIHIHLELGECGKICRVGAPGDSTKGAKNTSQPNGGHTAGRARANQCPAYSTPAQPKRWACLRCARKGGRTDGRAGGFTGLVRLLAGSALIRTGD